MCPNFNDNQLEAEENRNKQEEISVKSWASTNDVVKIYPLICWYY